MNNYDFNRQALRNAKLFLEQDAHLNYNSYVITDVLTAIKALEKQIPKKPMLNDRDDVWKCPCCGEEDYMPHHMYKFCPNCGQAIEWSDAENGHD